MQIETKTVGPCTVLYLNGRLDVAWAEHFMNEAREIMRGGRHHLRVEASGLEYLSSAGIRVLIRTGREVAAVNGSFFIINPSPFVKDTLHISGLDLLLAVPDAPPEGPEPIDEIPQPADSRMPGMSVEVMTLDPSAFMQAESPCSWIPWHPVQDGDIVKLAFPPDTVGLGIGAPGRDPRDARPHFGEFLAVDGCLTWLPGGGENPPDYLVRSDQFVPEVYAVQALTATGSYSHLIRFSPNSKTSSIPLTDLIGTALKTTGADAVVMVCVAEIEGLVGAAISRSPGEITEGDHPERFPEVREWVAFCGERVHARQSALMTVFAARCPEPVLAAQLSASPSDETLFFHAHAAVLPYRPLQEGIITPDGTIQAFFETAEPVDLMHLLEDNRPIIGLGQSALLRGACWCAPLRYSQEERV